MHSPALSLEAVGVRESEALERLAASTGGQSLCLSAGSRGPVPAVKYHEGAAVALAEARRAIRRLPSASASASASDEGCLSGGDDPTRLAVHEIRARWEVQSQSAGRTGRSWVAYFAGGMDALAGLLHEE
ncbi:hypothetical protein ABIB54_002392 [Frigoribacterium sp. UYMn621]